MAPSLCLPQCEQALGFNGLICETSRVLLDSQADEHRVFALRKSIEGYSQDQVTDLHIWCIGHDIFAAGIVVVSDVPKSLIPSQLNNVHATVEVHSCTGPESDRLRSAGFSSG